MASILKRHNEYHHVVHEIDHMSDLHVDSSFHKQSMKLNNYVKIEEWLDSSLGETTVIQRLNKKRPKLSNRNQTQNRRRYMLTLKTVHILFVALTSIIRRRLFTLYSE